MVMDKGNNAFNQSFYVTISNMPCGSTGITCAKSMKFVVGKPGEFFISLRIPYFVMILSNLLDLTACRIDLYVHKLNTVKPVLKDTQGTSRMWSLSAGELQ